MNLSWGCSSLGRAVGSQSAGTGIETLLLHLLVVVQNVFQYDIDGGVAQMVERLLCMQEAQGSIPCSSKINFLLKSNLHHRAVLAERLRRTLKARVRKSVGSIPTDCIFFFSNPGIAQLAERETVDDYN